MIPNNKFANFILFVIFGAISYVAWPTSILNVPFASMTLGMIGAFLISCITGILSLVSLIGFLFLLYYEGKPF
jgi:hypothetical protein